MDNSLSIILPVHNAQNTLTQQVFRLLEMLPELTEQFEVIIVDDASSDDTEEIAAELAALYPQVRFTRHAHQQGISAAAKTGLEQTCGEIIFVQDDHSPLSHHDLCELWQWRNDPALVMARIKPQPRSADTNLIDRLLAWGHAVCKAATANGEGGIQMIRRRALDELNHHKSANHRLMLDRVARTDKVIFGNVSPKRPSFFSKLKEFALGQ